MNEKFETNLISDQERSMAATLSGSAKLPDVIDRHLPGAGLLDRRHLAGPIASLKTPNDIHPLSPSLLLLRSGCPAVLLKPDKEMGSYAWLGSSWWTLQ